MLKAYSIFDDKGEIFNVPFFKTTDGLALRDFADLCSVISILSQCLLPPS